MAYGDIGQPVTLQRILYSSTVIPGDTIILRAGTYSIDDENFGTLGAAPGLGFAFIGTPELPITIRAYPGERVILDGRVFLSGQYLILQDVELTFSHWPYRETSNPGSDPIDLEPERGSIIHGIGCKVINCIVHDYHNGLSINQVTPSEVYGCVIVYQGWQSTDRGHGHGMYNQNNTTAGRAVIENNILSMNFGTGIKIYGQGTNGCINFDVLDNISFYNGEPYTYPTPTTGQSWWDLEIGGSGGAALNNTIRRNMTYGLAELGWGDGIDESEITDNYFATSGRHAISWSSDFASISTYGIHDSIFTGNTMVGYGEDSAAGTTGGKFPVAGNTWLTYPQTTGGYIKLVPNKYDRLRAHLGIINYSSDNDVVVDITPWTTILPGDTVNVYNVLDYPDDVQELVVSSDLDITVNMEAVNHSAKGPLLWETVPNPFPVVGGFLLKAVVLSEPPVITEGASITVAMSKNGAPVPFALTLHATDADEGATLTWSIKTAPTNGSASASGTGTSKVISYTPASNYDGTDSFVVQVTDEFDRSDEIIVNVIISRTVYAMQFTPASRSMTFTRTA